MLEDYKDIITVSELCEILRIGRNTAYKLLNTDIIPSRQLGRVYKISKYDVIRFVESFSIDN